MIVTTVTAGRAISVERGHHHHNVVRNGDMIDVHLPADIASNWIGISIRELTDFINSNDERRTVLAEYDVSLRRSDVPETLNG